MDRYDTHKLDQLRTGDERSRPSLRFRIMKIHNQMDKTVYKGITTDRKVVSECCHCKCGHMMKKMQCDHWLIVQHQEVCIEPGLDIINNAYNNVSNKTTKKELKDLLDKLN